MLNFSLLFEWFRSCSRRRVFYLVRQERRSEHRTVGSEGGFEAKESEAQTIVSSLNDEQILEKSPSRVLPRRKRNLQTVECGRERGTEQIT